MSILSGGGSSSSSRLTLVASGMASGCASLGWLVGWLAAAAAAAEVEVVGAGAGAETGTDSHEWRPNKQSLVCFHNRRIVAGAAGAAGATQVIGEPKSKTISWLLTSLTC